MNEERHRAFSWSPTRPRNSQASDSGTDTCSLREPSSGFFQIDLKYFEKVNELVGSFKAQLKLWFDPSALPKNLTSCTGKFLAKLVIDN